MRSLITIVLLVGLLHTVVYAGTTGILEGKVKDKDTGEPLVGVSVLIVGTSVGVATDIEGRFQLNNIETGTYDVRFSIVGYQSMTYKDVIIRSNLRTNLSVELKQSAVELGEVEVMAERPLIEKDVTSTNFSFGQTQVEKLPIQNVKDLLTLFPSVTLEGNVRGGKTTEVVYLVDGLPLQDMVGGGLGSSLPKSSITEFSIQTGGFDAEYGNALSGVVNIITQRGSDRYKSIIRFEKDNWLAGGWNKQTNRATEGELTLSGPIVAEKLHYFTANVVQVNETRWWQDFKNFDITPAFTDLSGLAKIDYNISSRMKISAQDIYSFRRWHDYEFSWQFNLPGLPLRGRTSNRISTILSHTISDIVHYSLNLSYSYLQTTIGEGDKYHLDLTPYEYDFFLQYVASGNRAWLADTRQKIFTLKGDLVVQPNPLNFLKIGFELNQYDIFSDLVKYEPQRTYFGKILADEPQLNFSTMYHYYPRSGSMYLQDKLMVERDGAVVNLGVRWDFLDPRSERPVIEYIPLDSTNGQYESKVTKMTRASLKQQVSPRIGISFPLAWNVLLVMNYGHYFQFPLFDYMYSGINPQQLRSGLNVLAGNPDLKPERTHAWEVGVKYGINEKSVVSVTYFKKEFIDQIDSKTLLASKARSAGDYGFAEYVNNAFANAEGIEFVFTHRSFDFMKGSLGYTLMWTEGVSDYANQGINLAQWGFPVANTPYPLSWDQRHTIKLDVELYLPFSITGDVLWTFNTGKPYTYFPTRDGFTPQDLTEPFIPNNARLPSNNFVNMKFSRKFSIARANAITVYAMVNNLFNTLNAKWADSNGRIGGQLSDPSAYYEPRRFLLGIKYEM